MYTQTNTCMISISICIYLHSLTHIYTIWCVCICIYFCILSLGIGVNEGMHRPYTNDIFEVKWTVVPLFLGASYGFYDPYPSYPSCGCIQHTHTHTTFGFKAIISENPSHLCFPMLWSKSAPDAPGAPVLCAWVGLWSSPKGGSTFEADHISSGWWFQTLTLFPSTWVITIK